MIIIGLTGTIGAGKGTVVDYLTSHKGFTHYSARALLAREVEKRGLPITRDNLSMVANNLRHVHGPCYMAEALFAEAAKKGGNAIIESIRTTGEVKYLRQNPEFFLLAVNADLKTRYNRILKRNSETDHITFEKFKEDNEREMTSTDPYSQNIQACIELADALIYNNESIDELRASVDKALEAYLK